MTAGFAKGSTRSKVSQYLSLSSEDVVVSSIISATVLSESIFVAFYEFREFNVRLMNPDREMRGKNKIKVQHLDA